MLNRIYVWGIIFLFSICGNVLFSQSRDVPSLLEYILSHEVTTLEFRLCEQQLDTIYLISDTLIFESPLTGILCDQKIIINKIGKRSFNQPNDKEITNELFCYRIDQAKRNFKVYIMQPHTHFTIQYSVRKSKKKYKMINYETGRF